MPVGVSPQELMSQIDTRPIFDAKEDNRDIARYAVSPQTGLALLVAQENVTAGTPV
jgi:hypothetical protein